MDWCLARGGDELGLEFLGPPDPPPNAWAEVDSELSQFALVRPPADGARYAFNELSLAALRRVMSDGLFTYEPGLISLEDQTVFRRGRPLLTIITHEYEGALELAPEEQATLDIGSLPYHLKSRWG
jgi:hypothetical protein